MPREDPEYAEFLRWKRSRRGDPTARKTAPIPTNRRRTPEPEPDEDSYEGQIVVLDGRHAETFISRMFPGLVADGGDDQGDEDDQGEGDDQGDEDEPEQDPEPPNGHRFFRGRR